MSEHQVDAEALLTQHSQELHKYYQGILARYTDSPEKLIEAIAYSLYAGGKRLRPALVLESCRACGGDALALKSALPPPPPSS